MATLKDNFEQLIEGILDNTDKKNKKITQRIEEVNSDFDKANRKTEAKFLTMENKVSKINDNIEDIEGQLLTKIAKTEIKTINKEPLFFSEGEESNYSINVPKVARTDLSEYFQNSYWDVNSTGPKMNYFHPIELTQQELDDYIQDLKDHPEKDPKYYLADYDIKVGNEISRTGNVTFPIYADVNDLIVVKLSYDVNYNNIISHYNALNVYEDYTEAQNILNSAVTIPSDWTILEDTQEIKGTGYGWNHKYDDCGMVRHIVCCKYATSSIEHFTASFASVYVSSLFQDKYPSFRAFWTAYSNVTSYKYINHSKFNEMYEQYKIDNPDYNLIPAVVPVPQLNSNEFAVLCCSNIRGVYYLNKTNFVGPLLPQSTGFTQMAYGLFLTDYATCGFNAVDSSMYSDEMTNPATACNSYLVLKGPNNQSPIQAEKYECWAKIDDYHTIHSNYSIGQILVSQHQIFEKWPIKYDGSEIANKDYVNSLTQDFLMQMTVHFPYTDIQDGTNQYTYTSIQNLVVKGEKNKAQTQTFTAIAEIAKYLYYHDLSTTPDLSAIYFSGYYLKPDSSSTYGCPAGVCPLYYKGFYPHTFSQDQTELSSKYYEGFLSSCTRRTEDGYEVAYNVPPHKVEVYVYFEPGQTLESSTVRFELIVTPIDPNPPAAITENLDLTTVPSTAGEYKYVCKCTVTVDSSGNKTPVYTWELET